MCRGILCVQVVQDCRSGHGMSREWEEMSVIGKPGQPPKTQPTPPHPAITSGAIKDKTEATALYKHHNQFVGHGPTTRTNKHA